MQTDVAAHIYYVANAMASLTDGNYTLYAANDVAFGPGIPRIEEGCYDVLYTDPTAFYGVYPCGSFDVTKFVGRLDVFTKEDRIEYIPLHYIAGMEQTSPAMYKAGIQEGFKRIALYLVSYNTTLPSVDLLSAGIDGKWFTGNASLPNILHYTTAQFSGYLKDSSSYLYILEDTLFLHVTNGEVHSITELLPANYTFDYDKD